VVVPSAPVAAMAAPTGPAGSLEERLRTKSSPLVRKLAAEHGVELTAITGSGIAGRVTRKDLEAFLTSRPDAASAPAVGASMYAPAGVEQHGPLPTAWPGDVVEPMSKIRKLTSDHMAMARRVAAHVTTFWEIDLTRVARIRTAMRRDFEAQTGQKLTYMPFILQAVSAQLKRHPVLNAAVAGSDIIYRKQVNLGIANPGTFGSITGTPIIPVGTTAILCLGAIEKRPKVITGPDGEDTIAIRTCCYFSLSFDHKVVDGADADRFMGDLKHALETIPEAGF
jgi:2-oxoglutarate dehydrogenase E2 component (dihydrolipoamide succinyltransferase)